MSGAAEKIGATWAGVVSDVASNSPDEASRSGRTVFPRIPAPTRNASQEQGNFPRWRVGLVTAHEASAAIE